MFHAGTKLDQHGNILSNGGRVLNITALGNDFSEAYKMNNNYVQAIHNMGVCFEIKGDLVVAKEHYQKAIDLDNNFQPALDAINQLN